MSWTPPKRPDWVAAINRGEVPPVSDVAERPFDRDALLAEAAARQGEPGRGHLDAVFGHPDHPAAVVVDHLDRLVVALESEAELSVLGRSLTRRFILRLLEVRIQILRALRDDPGISEEVIDRPLFVAGAPRTGTTILYELLTLDDRHRAPRGWELLRPVPSPMPALPEPHSLEQDDADNLPEDPRIALTHRELVAPQTVVDGIRTIHAYGARQPKECLSAMSFAFQSEEFTSRYHIPSYAAWLAQADPSPAYAMHRLVFQILQRKTPKTKWVLKSPVHLHSLDAVFETYPDARIAITHRDPLRFLGSLTSLIANLRWAHSDRVDPLEIAAAHHHRFADTLARLTQGAQEKRWPESQLHHSLFQDFLRNPGRVVEELYARFDLTMEPSFRGRIAAHPASKTSGPAVAHRYSDHVVGDDAKATRLAFEDYQAHFGVPAEDPSAP